MVHDEKHVDAILYACAAEKEAALTMYGAAMRGLDDSGIREEEDKVTEAEELMGMMGDDFPTEAANGQEAPQIGYYGCASRANSFGVLRRSDFQADSLLASTATAAPLAATSMRCGSLFILVASIAVLETAGAPECSERDGCDCCAGCCAVPQALQTTQRLTIPTSWHPTTPPLSISIVTSMHQHRLHTRKTYWRTLVQARTTSRTWG